MDSPITYRLEFSAIIPPGLSSEHETLKIFDFPNPPPGMVWDVATAGPHLYPDGSVEVKMAAVSRPKVLGKEKGGDQHGA